MSRLSIFSMKIWIFWVSNFVAAEALLKVIDSPTRQFKTLDGFWDFLPDYSASASSVNEEWWKKPLSQHGEIRPMPVPSSFNDITTDAKLKDHLGWVWYETHFTTPTLWLNSSGQYDPDTRKIFLRFESAHYYAMVFVNGVFLMEHSVGHLPFEAEVGSLLNTDAEGVNRLTVALNNTLNSTTVPPSAYNYKSNDTYYIYPAGYVEVSWQFDFFNYAGIHRPVKLYTTPSDLVTDVTIKTVPVDQAHSQWNLSVTVNASLASGGIAVSWKDESGSYQKLGTVENCEESVFQVESTAIWWPYTMDDHFGSLATLKVEIVENEKVVDLYTQEFGFRHVTWSNTSLFINGKKTYLTGINKHEDSDIRGKGLDYALIGRDFENQKWLGSNSFRTSHYPYAQEYLEMADREGVLVIGECPGVGIEKQNMVPETLATHERSIREMISRDKNHPSIFMWSLANEPSSDCSEAEDYFRDLFAASRPLDDTRPYTFVSDQMFDTDKALQFSDFLNINRYIGWYNDFGMDSWITEEVYHFVKNYHDKFNKPLIVQEYGAGTIAGFHKLPTVPFNEEYQWNLMNWTALAFDRLREEFMVGEFIWNYADFETELSIERVDGNKKGVFTRQRQPKMAAHFLRQRYLDINQEYSTRKEQKTVDFQRLKAFSENKHVLRGRPSH